MPASNFTLGIIAIARDISLFMEKLLYNNMFLGFIAGFVISLLIIGYVLTKNPANIPTMLRYNAMDSFQKIAGRDKNGTYNMAYSDFVHMYAQTRTLMLVSFISFCVMVITILLTQ